MRTKIKEVMHDNGVTKYEVWVKDKPTDKRFRYFDTAPNEKEALFLAYEGIKLVERFDREIRGKE